MNETSRTNSDGDYHLLLTRHVASALNLLLDALDEQDALDATKLAKGYVAGYREAIQHVATQLGLKTIVRYA